jgi:hypothetical protein
MAQNEEVPVSQDQALREEFNKLVACYLEMQAISKRLQVFLPGVSLAALAKIARVCSPLLDKPEASAPPVERKEPVLTLVKPIEEEAELTELLLDTDAASAPAPSPVNVLQDTKPLPSPAKKTAAEKASETRRAVKAGEKPLLRNAIVQVMGDQEMGCGQVFEALAAKGWLPASTDAKAYISFILSGNPAVFTRVARGIYKVAEQKL